MSKQKIFNTAVLLLLVFSLLSGGITARVDATQEALPASPVDESVVPHYFGPYPNWGLSALTMPDVSVTINGDGSGATATATVGAGGAITSVNITNPGSNYTNATVSFSGAGAGAAVVAGCGSRPPLKPYPSTGGAMQANHRPLGVRSRRLRLHRSVRRHT